MSCVVPQQGRNPGQRSGKYRFTSFRKRNTTSSANLNLKENKPSSDISIIGVLDKGPYKILRQFARTLFERVEWVGGAAESKKLSDDNNV